MLLLAVVADAQYFGQNRVRFKPLEFKVLKTPHFDIHYYPEERDAAHIVGRMAERWYARLSQVLNHELPPAQPVVLYDSHPAFRQTTVLPQEIGVGTGGVTEGLKRRVVLPMAGTLAETDHVLGHELVHAFQYDMTSRPSNTLSGGEPGAATLPLWFVEGMAEYLSVGSADPHTAMWLRDSLQHEKLPRLKDLEKPEFFPYRFGQAFWSYVGGRFGDDVIGRMLVAAARGGPEQAIRSVLEVTPEELQNDWHRSLSDQYQVVLRNTQRASAAAATIVAAKPGRGSINVSPALSPDGSQVVIFSQRGIFSIDLYLADARTGKIIKTLTQTAVDPHLDSLEFIYGSGSWSHDGRYFAFSTLKTGKPRIVILSMPDGEELREIPVADVGEIFTLTWSPNGDRLALSAIAGGLTDLYAVDVQTGRLEQLTKDTFGDLQPAWSPDGTEIAFVTERFGGNLDTLSFGNYRLALLDMRTKDVRPLASFPVGKQTSPQWSRDGTHLFFVSDRNGVSNVYSLSVEDGAIRQLTNIDTGVSGIAALSPAVSSAAGSDRLMFSVFETGSYGLYLLDNFAQLTGYQLRHDFTFEVAGGLPPVEFQKSTVAHPLRQQGGLVQPSTFATIPYRPKLTLDYAAPPSIEVAAGSYGSAVGGGMALYWSDLLGQHNLMTSVGAVAFGQGNPLRNLSGTAVYLNQKSRWNWGVVGGQAPLISEGYSTGLGTVGGNLVVVSNSIRFWQIERQVSGLVSYPFNRAARIEFSSGYRNIAFAARQEQTTYSASTGQLLATVSGDLPTAPSLHMATGATALVFDSSVTAGVSPLWGQRYRLEVSANQGSITYTTALADYRRYVRLPGKLTLAGRVLHFGRYGGGAEDSRLQDLSLGYAALVRGYSIDSFRASECGNRLQTYGDCPALDQLFGSRIAVANSELRLPLLGSYAAIPTRHVPPVEAAVFYDTGAAWRKTETIPFFQTNSRHVVQSYGTSLRVNILGIAVGQMSYVYPIDRGIGWHFEFALTSGF
jgi:Tol biopolymer transport system component